MVASTSRQRSLVYILLVFVSNGTVMVNLLPRQSKYFRDLSDSIKERKEGLGCGEASGDANVTDDPVLMNGDIRSIGTEGLDLDRLRAPSDTCFYAEGLCFGSNRLFYRTDQKKQQPEFNLNLYYRHVTNNRHDGYEDNYTSFHMTANETQHLECVDSKTRFHVILFSAYSDMLGEFYSRSLVGLFALLQTQNVSVEAFVRDSQMYLHRMNFHKPLMDSHHLFTNALRSSALQDMMQLLDSTQCQCLPRVLFCGYEVTPQVESESHHINHTYVQLAPSEGLFTDNFVGHKPVYAQIRNFLRSKLILDSPFAVADIQRYRQSVITKTVGPNMTLDYKIIGLAQRSGRRTWRNLDNVLEAWFRPMLDQGIILLEVNLDAKSWTPYQQMIRHAGLDGLVGIHGAQLTQAIWMKPGSLVMELLPFIPSDIRYGHWTRERIHPTPLGVIFDETDLLHVGYSLGRDSVPYCYNDTLDCWRDNTWDDRDFLLSIDELLMILDKFVTNRPRSCDEYNQTSFEIPELVVYNALCVEAPTSNTSSVRHFYKQMIMTSLSNQTAEK